MKASERNALVIEMLEDLYTRANDESYTIDESGYADAMDYLFTTTAWGFREIILVVVIGMKLDENYRASTGLYDCEPRGIYEHPIKEFFIDKNIPHRQSGPLNIAKATKGLNEAWAAQRRPQEVADNVLTIINYLENKPTKKKTDDVGISLLRRLIRETQRVEELSVDLDPSEDPDWIFHLCHELIEKTPDAGNTPQKIAAFLLKSYHNSMKTGIVVTGEDDRASVTSTTSKKPGDVNEESPLGEIYKVYEITVKLFGLARIRDSYDCIVSYNNANNSEINEVLVVCRKQDCPPDIMSSSLGLYLGKYEYQNITYRYLEIYEWIAETLQRMTAEGRLAFYNDLNNYISDVNTAEAVKKLWKELHSV